VGVVFDQEFIEGSDLLGRYLDCTGKTFDAATTRLNLSCIRSEYRSSRPAKSAHKVLSASQLDAPLQIMTRAPHWWRRHSMKSHECVKVLVRALERAAELLPGTSRAAVISTNDSH